MSRLAPTLSDAVARYMARSERRGGCLLAPSKKYGMVTSADAGQVSAHRASYLVHNGPIPEGLVVRHTCDEPRCIEPTHLLVGTYKDNEADKIERGRAATGLRNHMAQVPPAVIEAAVTEYLAGGVSQRAMARRLGVDQSTFGRWLMGKTRRDAGLVGVRVGVSSRISRPPLMPCGTAAGCWRHRRHREPVCEPCLAAEREYTAARAAARKASAA